MALLSLPTDHVSDLVLAESNGIVCSLSEAQTYTILLISAFPAALFSTGFFKSTAQDQ